MSELFDANNAVDVSLHRVETLVRLVDKVVGDIIEAGLLDQSPVLDSITVLLETLERDVEDTKAAVECLRKAVKDKPDAPPAA